MHGCLTTWIERVSWIWPNPSQINWRKGNLRDFFAMVGMSGPMFNPKPAGIEVSTVDNFHAFWALCLNFAIFCQGVRFLPNMDPDVVQAASLDHNPWKVARLEYLKLLECLPQRNLEPLPRQFRFSKRFPDSAGLIRVLVYNIPTSSSTGQMPYVWAEFGLL